MPTVPPHALAFQHPSGEIHITGVSSDGNDATMEACPGQENQVGTKFSFCDMHSSTVKQNCSDSLSEFDASVSNHLGPYFEGISFGGQACPA